MTPRPWNTGELKVLDYYAGLGSQVLAELLDRSIGSIEAKAKERKISLVATGEDFDTDKLTKDILNRLRQIPSLSICPLCGSRLATMKASGMCRVCHLDQLITLRETQLLEIARERKLVKLRQDKRRLKVCSICGRPFYPRVGSDIIVCQDCDGIL